MLPSAFSYSVGVRSEFLTRLNPAARSLSRSTAALASGPHDRGRCGSLVHIRMILHSLHLAGLAAHRRFRHENQVRRQFLKSRRFNCGRIRDAFHSCMGTDTPKGPSSPDFRSSDIKCAALDGPFVAVRREHELFFISTRMGLLKPFRQRQGMRLRPDLVAGMTMRTTLTRRIISRVHCRTYVWSILSGLARAYAVTRSKRRRKKVHAWCVLCGDRRATGSSTLTTGCQATHSTRLLWSHRRS